MGNSLSPRRGGGHGGSGRYSRLATADDDEDLEEVLGGDFYRRAALSRAVSTRVLSQTVRRPHGFPRQVASLVALDPRGLGRLAAAGSYLYLGRWASAVGLAGGGGGRRRHRSLPAISSILRDHGIVYEYLAEALRGKR